MTKLKVGDIVRHKNNISDKTGKVSCISNSGALVDVDWDNGRDTHHIEYLEPIHRKPNSELAPPQWFTVPSYNVSTEPHKIINRNGELVARFEDLDEAVRVAELWNREVGK